MKKEYQIAIKAAVEAGRKIIEIYESDNFEIEIKDDESPLTIADRKANEIIVSQLSSTNFPIISEELKQLPYEERKNWEKCWIVDPLDGTKEFLKKNGEFTVNIALVENQKPIFGVIYVPVSREVYFGTVESNKSYKVQLRDFNNIDVDLEQAQEIFPNNKTGEIRVVGSRSHMNDDTKIYIENLQQEKNVSVKIVSKGSSLKFCLVAEGLADVYPRFAPTMEWDTAAGQAICKAVGLNVLDQKTGKELVYNRENLLNNYFLVTKGM